MIVININGKNYLINKYLNDRLNFALFIFNLSFKS